jgi:glycosyltransferase involved in cell wall biosynthesis
VLTIGYDGTAAVRQTAGIGRYARELLIALSGETTDEQFRVIASARGARESRPELGDRFEWRDLPVSDRVSNAVWHRLRVPVPVEARTGRLDVFHSPDFSLAPSRCPSIVTIHDLAFETMPQVSVPTLAEYLHRVVPKSIRRASKVIAPSAYTKDAIVRRFGTDPLKIDVIPEGVSGRFSAQSQPDDLAVVKGLGISGDYILTAGTLEPRKNLERTLKAFATLEPEKRDLTLVVAGQRGWMYETIFACHKELGLADRVMFLGYVNDDILPALYRCTVLTVYASLLEGFGLPALEALACGSPLVASGNSSIPEVCGSAAVYVDPWDVEDMTETIRSALDDEALLSRLRAAGPTQAATFTWKVAAQRTLALYHDVAAA